MGIETSYQAQVHRTKVEDSEVLGKVGLLALQRAKLRRDFAIALKVLSVQPPQV